MRKYGEQTAPAYSRRDFLQLVGAGTVAGAVMPRWLEAAAPATAAAKPNLVVILADDLGYECLGAYGNRRFKTPHLDRLAAEGVRFTHCYAQPLCTPTRVQLMTGLYNVRNYTDFGHLDEGQVTFANLLKAAGYATAITGKWQLGGKADRPRHFGFDEYCLWQHLRRPPRYANPGLEINGQPKDFTHGEYGPDLVHAAALDFIARNQARPFCLYYTMMLTHDPFQPTPDSPDWDPRAIGEKVHDDPKHFPDMVAYMDKQVGSLVAKLEQLRLRERTLILFLGDNGTSPAITSEMADGTKVRGGKGDSTDGGTHVPLIANFPGVTKAGTVCGDLVDTTDFLPTLCAAAGATVPAALGIDGRSFLPPLRGEKGSPREWVYSWFARGGGPTASKEFARTQRYKLYADGRLFDLAQTSVENKTTRVMEANAEARAARTLLQSALDQYKTARPAKFAAAGAKARPDGRGAE